MTTYYKTIVIKVMCLGTKSTMDWKREFRSRFINIVYLIYNVGDNCNAEGERVMFSINGARLDKHMKKNSSHIKINSRWIIDLNVKSKIA